MGVTDALLVICTLHLYNRQPVSYQLINVPERPMPNPAKP
jgi:hypothetical protein